MQSMQSITQIDYLAFVFLSRLPHDLPHHRDVVK
jgi:hypothetical protein